MGSPRHRNVAKMANKSVSVSESRAFRFESFIFAFVPQSVLCVPLAKLAGTILFTVLTAA